VVALSLMLTPLIMIVNDKLVQPRFVTQHPHGRQIDDNENPVIIAGFGRFGQIVGRLLIANGFKATVLIITGQIDMLRRFGFKCTGMRPSLICYMRREHNKPLFVVAIDDREKALDTVDLVRAFSPPENFGAGDRPPPCLRTDPTRGGGEGKPWLSWEMGVEALKLLGVRSQGASSSPHVQRAR